MKFHKIKNAIVSGVLLVAIAFSGGCVKNKSGDDLWMALLFLKLTESTKVSRYYYIIGTVSESSTGEPVANGSLSASELEDDDTQSSAIRNMGSRAKSSSVPTDLNGSFKLELKAGTYRVVVYDQSGNEVGFFDIIVYDSTEIAPTIENTNGVDVTVDAFGEVGEEETESTLSELKYTTDHISIYVTNPLSDPEADDAVIDLVNHADSGESLDLCLYGLDRENLLQAIESAIDRGVHVRFVGDKDGSGKVSEMEGDYYEGYYRVASRLDTKFPVSGKKRVNFPDDDGFDDFRLVNGNAIQHNKFGVIRHTNGDTYLFMGTTNITETGFERNNNNLLIFNHSGIASVYQQQFEYLLGLSGSAPVSTVNTFTIDGIKIDVLFSPQDLDGKSAMDHLMELVDTADSSIHFLIFSFPHRYLNDLIISKYFDEGVDVKGVFDQSQLNNHEEEYYAQQGIPVRIDGNFHVENGHGGKLHHKTMILDSAQNDAVVVTGSFNWSNNANENNDENMIFIHSKAIAQFYEQEFDRRFEEGKLVSTQEPGDDAEAGDVIINEVMWPGRRNAEGKSSYTDYTDEFIELKNTTSERIDLSGWSIKGGAMSGKPIVISEGTYIDGNSLLVLMHHWPEDSAWAPGKYRVETQVSLANTEMYLILEDPDRTVIDVVASKGTVPEDFSGTNGTPKRSMARYDDIGDGSKACNWFSSTTQVNINAGFLDYNYATPGTENGGGLNGCGGNPGDTGGTPGSTSFEVRDVIISEIAWAGSDTSSYDEWIELYNNTSSSITLSGWVITIDSGTTTDVELSGTIPAKGYYLMERNDDDSVPGIAADLIYSGGLNNTGTRLILVGPSGNTIDQTPDSNWVAGKSSPKIAMARKEYTVDGALESSWKDGVGDIEGAVNSAGATLGEVGGGEISVSGLVINEIGNRIDGTTENDFIELYNTTSEEVDMTGLYVARYSNSKCTSIAGGTSTSATNWINLSGYAIPAGGYFTISRSGYSLSHIDFADGSLSAVGTDECVALLNGQSSIDSVTHADVLDFVGWGSSAAFEGSAAMDIGDDTAISRCSNGSDSDNNSSDFTLSAHTPGEANSCSSTVFSTGFESGDDILTSSSGTLSQGDGGCSEYGNYLNGSGGLTFTSITTSYTGRDAETSCLALNNLSGPVFVDFSMIADPGNGGNELRSRANIEWYTDAGCSSSHSTTPDDQSTGIVISEGTYTSVSGVFTPPDATVTHIKVSMQMKDNNGGSNAGDNFCIDDFTIKN